MATMPGGAPYPLGTDKVVNGDDAIKALATYADITHAEYQGDATAQNGTNVAVSNWVIGAATSWGSVVTINGANLQTVQASGLYALLATVRFGAPIAGRSYADLYIGGALVARGTGGAGDDQLSVAVPAVLIGVGVAIQLVAFQTSGSAQSVYGTVRITRQSPGKPAGLTTFPSEPEAPPILVPGPPEGWPEAEGKPA